MLRVTHLKPMSPSSLRRLLATHLRVGAPEAVPKQLVSAVARVTAGHPLLAEEVGVVLPRAPPRARRRGRRVA